MIIIIKIQVQTAKKKLNKLKGKNMENVEYIVMIMIFIILLAIWRLQLIKKNMVIYNKLLNTRLDVLNKLEYKQGEQYKRVLEGISMSSLSNEILTELKLLREIAIRDFNVSPNSLKSNPKLEATEEPFVKEFIKIHCGIKEVENYKIHIKEMNHLDK